MKPITTEQKFEKRFFDVYQEARKKVGGADPQLDAAYDPIFEVLLAEFKGAVNRLDAKFSLVPKTALQKSGKAKPAKKGKAVGKPQVIKTDLGNKRIFPKQPKAEPLTDTDVRFGIYVDALKNALNFGAPKSEWRKREPGEVASLIRVGLNSRNGRVVFGNALRYVLKVETAKTYLVPPTKN